MQAPGDDNFARPDPVSLPMPAENAADQFTEARLLDRTWPVSWRLVPPDNARLDALIEEALVDAYDDYEQAAAFHTMIADHLAVPFETTVLGVEVTVVKIEDRPGTGIAAICRAGSHRQAIGICDLPLPDRRPEGSDWIDAYRRWSQ